MTGIYKIRAVYHNGRAGVRGKPRTDGDHPKRIGRVVELNLLDLVVGFPCMIKYLFDSDGSDFSRKALLTSKLTKPHIVQGNIVILETVNSIYEFEKQEDK